jgi:hypothetical protein
MGIDLLRRPAQKSGNPDDLPAPFDDQCASLSVSSPSGAREHLLERAFAPACENPVVGEGRSSDEPLVGPGRKAEQSGGRGWDFARVPTQTKASLGEFERAVVGKLDAERRREVRSRRRTEPELHTIAQQHAAARQREPASGFGAREERVDALDVFDAQRLAESRARGDLHDRPTTAAGIQTRERDGVEPESAVSAVRERREVAVERLPQAGIGLGGAERQRRQMRGRARLDRLEHGQDFRAQAISRDREVGVAGVLAVREAASGEIVTQLGAGKREQRPQHAPSVEAPSDRREPADARAAERAEEQRLGLVLALVRGGDVRESAVGAQFFERRVAQCSSAGLGRAPVARGGVDARVHERHAERAG